MKQRCFNPRHKNFKDYGGRGISVCDEWKKDFQAFYDWAMANGYRDDLSIDRISMNGSYIPENCRWVSQKTQCNNKRTNLYIQIGKEKKSLSEWCDLYGADYETVRGRLRIGWSPEEALGLKARQK